MYNKILKGSTDKQLFVSVVFLIEQKNWRVRKQIT